MSSLMKDTTNNSENGSNSSSNGEIGGNNSDNSALVSLGNTSFGFNFDSEEGINGSPRNSSNSEEGDSSDQGDGRPKVAPGKASVAAGGTAKATSGGGGGGSAKGMSTKSNKKAGGPPHQHRKSGASSSLLPPPKPIAASSLSAGAAAAAQVSSDSSSRATANTVPSATSSSSHSDAAAEAVASLQSIATASNRAADITLASGKQGLKRKAPDSTADNDSSNGYNSDDEGKAGAQDNDGEPANRDDGNDEDDDAMDDLHSGDKGSSSDCGGGQKGSRKKKKLDDMKREERNAREKERSFRISRQINELRNLLSTGGVIVPKGTKSSVLTEAANYIRMLQQHQYRSEIDRHQLVQQIQMIGGGALGQQAATAVRHVAAQNGVWSLGNFGGVPPKSAMMYHQTGAEAVGSIQPQVAQSQPQDGSSLPNKIEDGDYRHVFNSCTVGMAIASMGGAFIDCNKLFCQLSNYTKQEVCSMTVFNLTARQDLQPAFDLISQMLSAPADPGSSNTSCVLRGSFKHRNDLGLNVTLIKGEDGVAKCFCVTIILNPSSPFDTSRPVPATIELINTNQMMPISKDASQAGLDPSPAYTAG